MQRQRTRAANTVNRASDTFAMLQRFHAAMTVDLGRLPSKAELARESGVTIAAIHYLTGPRKRFIMAFTNGADLVRLRGCVQPTPTPTEDRGGGVTVEEARRRASIRFGTYQPERETPQFDRMGYRVRTA